jgi:hypothetical protein
VTGTSSETYFETNRVDIFATHAGENVSFVQTNYDDSGWRVESAARLGGGIALQFERGPITALSRLATPVLAPTTSAGIATRSRCPRPMPARRCGWNLTAFTAIAWCG